MRHSTDSRRLTRLRRRLVLLLAALFLLAGAGEALARSGARFGGGFRSRSFSSSSSRSSRSFSYSPSSRSSSWRPSSGGGTNFIPIPIPIGGGPRYGYGGGYASTGSALSGLVVLLLIGGAIVVVILVLRMRAGRMVAASEAAQRVDVANVQFGVQAQARHIQERLEAMAETVDTTTEEGLAAILREVAIELRRNAEYVEYAAIEVAPKLGYSEAEGRFNAWTSDARSRYNREVLSRDAGGKLLRGQKEVATDGLRDEDGQLAVSEFFVVSVVAALRGVPVPTELHGHQELDALLDRLSQVTTDRIVAVEVVWSPASLSDSMSREDMQLRYPMLFPV